MSWHAGGRKSPAFQDLRVARAAAPVSRQRLANLVARRVGVSFEERLGGKEDAWRAVAALRCSEPGEGLRTRMKRWSVLHALHRCDGALFQLDRQQEAAQLWPSVDQHRACAALTELAPMLGAGQLQAPPQALG